MTWQTNQQGPRYRLVYYGQANNQDLETISVSLLPRFEPSQQLSTEEVFTLPTMTFDIQGLNPGTGRFNELLM